MPWLLLGAVLVFGAFLKGGSVGTEAMFKNPFNEWDDLIRKYSKQFDVPFRYIKAIMLNESNLGRAPSVVRGLENPEDIEASKSSDGKSWGLMQLTLPTARMFESAIMPAGLNDPEVSVRIGTKYLAWIIARKGLDEEKVSRSYNGGTGYLTTVQGKRDTPAYYERFKRNLALVDEDDKSRQV